ncbi:ABC transporter ATP-binding protein [Serinicoccus kebangsaanensis]|uniref:ABC transporter ATP-binding protein n=1 Tax=Serinicoccus kebangsaanensis TaxID=2602069 RepID=UPI00124BEA97|nr:ABC transporter ATP-binding protein [Serinicoccus kebangsaanensis]
MSDHLIEIDGLRKTFGRTTALDGLDLVVDRGEVHGFLGPNGAGKSTTIRILLGLMRADGGSARLFGGDPWADAVELHSRLAYVPGDVTLWPGLTGGQCIDILARAHGQIDESRRAELIDRFDLDPSKRSRDYSKGNRQKVSLVAALATDSELLVLDEPTSGLDPLMEEVFQQVVGERREQGTTVLLSSHILGEVEALADRVSIIRAGRTVTTGTLTDLRRHTHSTVRAVTDQRPALEGMPGVSDVETGTDDEGRHEVHASAEPDAVGRLVGVLHDAGIHTLTVTPPSLDDLFLQAYAGDETLVGAR